jgi:predicted nucleic acid-binding Zn ribbon protein
VAADGGPRISDVAAMPNERGGATPLAEALRRYLSESGLAGRLEQASVIEAWPGLVGPVVASATKPLAVAADGTLFVAVRTSAWMAELAMMERDILAAVNRRFASGEPENPAPERDRGRITRIRWQLAR